MAGYSHTKQRIKVTGRTKEITKIRVYNRQEGSHQMEKLIGKALTIF